MNSALASPLARIALALSLALLLAGIFALHSCRQARTAAAEADLARRQQSAAIASGRDAVHTLGDAQANEQEIHEIVKEGQDAITGAPAGDSNDAADRGACRLRSYRHSSKCVSLLGPLAE